MPNAPAHRAVFKRVTVEPKSHFQKGTFRVVTVNTHRVVLACPKGVTFHPGDGRDDGGHCAAPRPQAILHPVREHNPCGQCDRITCGMLW